VEDGLCTPWQAIGESMFVLEVEMMMTGKDERRRNEIESDELKDILKH